MKKKATTFSHRFMLDLIGQLVSVSTELHRVRDDAAARWEARPAAPRGPRNPVGWVVGFRWRLVGNITPGSGPHWGIDGFDGGDSPEFKETGPRIPCLLVVYWPTMLPVSVPLDGYARVTDPQAQPTAPSRTGCNDWTERDRQTYRELAAEMPRDAKGRWLPAQKGRRYLNRKA